MKRVTLNSDGEVKFLIRGVRHSRNAVEVIINKKGVVVDDPDAEIIEDRLGQQVTISKTSSKDAEAEAEAAVKAAKAEAKKAEAEAKKAEAEAEKKAKAAAKKAAAEAAKNK